MMIDRQMYDDWRRKPAGETFEFLSVINVNDAFIDKICRSITAFLNTSGGTIVLLIPRHTSAHELADRVMLSSDMEITPRPSIEVNVFVVELGKGEHIHSEVVVIEVPVGYEKPYSRKTEILVRRGESIQTANRQDILTLLGEHEDPDTRWERQLLPGATEADLNSEKIHECLKREEVSRIIQKQPKSYDDSLIWTFLRYFNLGRRPSLRNGAIVLFGRSPAVFFPQTAIRVVAYYSDEADSPGIVDEKTLSRNLFDNIDECMFFCERHTLFASSFPTGDDMTFQRGQTVGYPFAALREAILNALVHRDFTSFDTNVTIKITPSSIEVWNPGAFPKGADLDKLEDFRVSRPPNPDIAHVLQRMGYIERLGSGINRIIKLFEQNGLPRPRWEQVGGGVRITLKTSRENNARLDSLAKKVFANLEDGEVLSRKRFMSISGLSVEDSDHVIDFLCKMGLLHKMKGDLFKVKAS